MDVTYINHTEYQVNITDLQDIADYVHVVKPHTLTWKLTISKNSVPFGRVHDDDIAAPPIIEHPPGLFDFNGDRLVVAVARVSAGTI